MATSYPTFQSDLKISSVSASVGLSGSAVYGLSGASDQFPNFVSDVRNQFSGSGDISYDSATGIISYIGSGSGGSGSSGWAGGDLYVTGNVGIKLESNVTIFTASLHTNDANTVALWRMDDSTGSLTDETDYGNNLEYYADWSNPDAVIDYNSVGKYNGSFNTTSDIGASVYYKCLASQEVLSASNGSFTIEGWFKILDVTSYVEFDFWSDTNNTYFYADYNNGVLEIGWSGNDTYYVKTFNPGEIDTEIYHHLAITANKNLSDILNCTLYLDGQNIATFTDVVDPAYDETTELIFYSLENVSVDDWRISNIARTANEILLNSVGVTVTTSKTFNIVNNSGDSVFNVDGFGNLNVSSSLTVDGVNVFSLDALQQNINNLGIKLDSVVNTYNGSPHALDSNTVALFRLNDTSLPLTDETGNGNDLTEVTINGGDVTYGSTGKFGGCLNTSNDGDYVFYTTNTSIEVVNSINNDFSFEFWTKLSGTVDNTDSYASVGLTDNFHGLSFTLEKTDVSVILSYFLQNDLNGIVFNEKTISSFNDSEFHHVAMTVKKIDASSLRIAIYLDSELIDESIATFTFNISELENPLLQISGLRSLIDDVRVSNTSRTLYEILQSTSGIASGINNFDIVNPSGSSLFSIDASGTVVISGSLIVGNSLTVNGIDVSTLSGSGGGGGGGVTSNEVTGAVSEVLGNYGLVLQNATPQEIFNLTGSTSTTATAGRLYDSGGPLGNYNNNQKYYFIVKNNIDTSYTININDLDTEGGWDYFFVYRAYDSSILTNPITITGAGNLNTSDFELLHLYDGSPSTPITLSHPYDNIVFVFYSDNSVVYPGYDVTWQGNTFSSTPTANYTGSLSVENNITASNINIENILKLQPLSTLPSGNLGSLAVSGSGLYFHNGSSWNLIS